MSYQTTNEFEHFRFNDSYISEMQQMNGYFYAILDQVMILPENSCNRDIREMRTNQLKLTILDGQITSFVEEGYRVYNADGKLLEQHEDTEVSVENYTALLKSFPEQTIYSIEKSDNEYTFTIDTEEHVYILKVTGTSDREAWDRFMNIEGM